MNKFKILIFSFVLFVIFPSSSKALFCDYSELSRLKKIANNVDLIYYFNEDDEIKTFSFEFNNLDESIYIKDVYNNKEYLYKGRMLNLGNYESGKRYVFEINTIKTDCPNKNLLTLSITLPKYNPYYLDKVCEDGISICDKWSDHKLSYSDFIKKVEKLKKEKNSFEEEPIEPEQKKNLFVEYSKYYVPLIFSSMIIFILVKRHIDNKNDFDLNTN